MPTVAGIDQNSRQTLLCLSSAGDGTFVVPYADPITHRLLVDSASGAGTVTSVSVVTANGISGSVANPTTTPAITLTLGGITPSSIQVSGLTASQILGTDASKNIVSLATATYPSLTELSYVKGVTSAIQTQLNAKGSGTVTATGGSLTANAIVLGAGSTDTKVVAGIVTDGAAQISLGVNTTTLGTLKMFGNTSGDVTVRPTAVAGTATVQTLPATTGTLVNRVTTANGVSASNTDGALSFTLGAITPTTVNGNTFTTGSSTYTGTAGQTYTFPTTSATVARTDAAQTFTGLQTYSNAVNYTNNAIAASGNAATVPITARIHTVTNNSAATLTITLTTASAVDGQLQMIRVLDFSAVAQTITWVNTENSNVSAPTTSNGSTTLPLTVGFQYNSSTSKWRCVASA